jgi:pyridoxine 4-dehydrogenase
MPHTTLTAKLGNHDVGRIGFGAMQLAGPGVFGPPRDRDGALAVLRRAIALGVDHIDTSQYYGPDIVNELIREALHPYPDGLRLVTKVGARRDDKGAWLPALRPEQLRAGVEDNLRTLGIEQLTLVNLRLLDEEPGIGGTPPLAEMLGALDDMRREGKLELIGLSNATRALLGEALDLVPIAGVQNQYSVLDRSNEDVLEACREHGLAFVPFFPLGSAVTGGPQRLAEDPAIARVAAKHGVTPSQVALAWLLQRDERILLIPGTSSVPHLEENLAAADVELDADDMTALADVEPAGNPLEAVHD